MSFKINKMIDTNEFVKDSNIFLRDIRKIEKDTLKIKETIHYVSGNENIKRILETLNNIQELEEKIKVQEKDIKKNQ